MMNSTRVALPTLVRIKPHALARLGVYLARFQHQRVAAYASAGLSGVLLSEVQNSLGASGIVPELLSEVTDNDFEQAVLQFARLPRGVTAILGLGGGKALDTAKYVAFLAKLPYFAVPTSLSNDGYCSPQASLMLAGKRRSLAAAMPFGVVVDTVVCAAAPTRLTLSGVGDVMAKVTAISDWKLAFHHTGELIDDFAVLLADSAVHSFLSRCALDEEGIRLLANSLLLSGIAMEVCGSSRPASGSEHLISHALDEISSRPRLHGLQVGVAAYLVSLLQGQHSEKIAQAFEKTGFWQIVAQEPFSAAEWLAAVRRAPEMKPGFFTILSARDTLPEVAAALRTDRWLARCFGP